MKIIVAFFFALSFRFVAAHLDAVLPEGGVVAGIMPKSSDAAPLATKEFLELLEMGGIKLAEADAEQISKTYEERAAKVQKEIKENQESEGAYVDYVNGLFLTRQQVINQGRLNKIGKYFGGNGGILGPVTGGATPVPLGLGILGGSRRRPFTSILYGVEPVEAHIEATRPPPLSYPAAPPIQFTAAA